MGCAVGEAAGRFGERAQVLGREWGVQRRAGGWGGFGEGGPARWVVGECRRGVGDWVRMAGVAVGWDGLGVSSGSRTGHGWGRTGEDGGAGEQRSVTDPVPSGGSAREGLGGGQRLLRAWLHGGVEVALLVGCYHGNFGGSCGVLVPTAGGLVVLGKKVTSEVDPGTQTIPACARGTQEQGQPELCSIFTHAFPCAVGATCRCTGGALR